MKFEWIEEGDGRYRVQFFDMDEKKVFDIKITDYSDPVSYTHLRLKRYVGISDNLKKVKCPVINIINRYSNIPHRNPLAALFNFLLQEIILTASLQI